VRVKLHLRVHPPSEYAYETSVEWMIDPARMSEVQEGSRIAVKIDAEDPQIVYPYVSWAQAYGMTFDVPDAR
jgi:hypothetical protein